MERWGETEMERLEKIECRRQKAEGSEERESRGQRSEVRGQSAKQTKEIEGRRQ